MNTAIIIILAIIALPLVLALFISKDYRIEREVTINRPKHEVFDYIKYIRNQDHYSKWVQTDPNMHKEFRGTDGTIGFVYAWNGNKQAGEGEQEITGITEGERITTELRFKRPMANTAHVYMDTEAATEHSTRVRWGFTGHSSYPMNLMTAMLSGVLGKDMETSLQQLKALLENR